MAVGSRTGWKGRANSQALQNCTQVLVRQVSYLSGFTEGKILVCIYGVLLGRAWWYQAAIHENKLGAHGKDPCFKNGTENAISREASSTAVLWCLSSLIMLVLLKKTTSFSAFAFYPRSMAVQTNLFYRCVRRVFTDKEERYWHLKHYLESVDRSYRNFASFDLLVLWEGFNMNIWRLLEAGLSC